MVSRALGFSALEHSSPEAYRILEHISLSIRFQVIEVLAVKRKIIDTRQELAGEDTCQKQTNSSAHQLLKLTERLDILPRLCAGEPTLQITHWEEVSYRTFCVVFV